MNPDKNAASSAPASAPKLHAPAATPAETDPVLTRRSSMPPFILRSWIWSIIAIVLLSLAGPIFQATRAWKLSSGLLLASILGPLALVQVINVTMIIRSTRIFRRARDMDGKMCWTCGYDLRGQESASNTEEVLCPECGSKHRWEDLRRRWYAHSGRAPK